ncbi:MAG: hypothetical protein QM572_14825, partial [Nocardioides sp.]|uniref:hypothetical protein n=1 Tax=Nocardioides sp. TaxID=35761 RepID=UPI0039E53FFB
RAAAAATSSASATATASSSATTSDVAAPAIEVPAAVVPDAGVVGSAPVAETTDDILLAKTARNHSVFGAIGIPVIIGLALFALLASSALQWAETGWRVALAGIGELRRRIAR